ncbi:MAG: hypothetical protein ETSY2_46545 [Candidatus Entotheonella gemina]|uniref:Uncharacterized protein n=1 Tax=Candidatus Entotheonella gemina TaxID=1429439 RepID=W4LE63_9BACT|nr:MAG: hypothetical protein ETSY2_46545 [Candidatus Entotheonella gemina]
MNVDACAGRTVLIASSLPSRFGDRQPTACGESQPSSDYAVVNDFRQFDLRAKMHESEIAADLKQGGLASR